jgi:gag-polyprotein putative aspartyl protease
MNDPSRRFPAGAFAIGCCLVVWMTLPASGDGSGSADAILQAKGLRRVGTSFVLPEEDDLGGRVERLRRSSEGWKRDRGRLEEELKVLDGLRRQYRQLSEARNRGDRFDGPAHPPGEPGLPPREPMPPLGPGPGQGPHGDGRHPDDMGVFGPHDRGGPPGPGRGNADRRRDDRYRAELEAKITLSQASAADLRARLEARMRQVQRRRDEAMDLRNRILARYAELSADPAVKQALEALQGTGAPTMTLGPVTVPTEELLQIDASLGRATTPPQDPAGPLELKGLSRLRGLVGAADLLVHEVAVDTGRLATLERDRVSRRKLLAEQDLKNPRRSESLREATAGQAPSARPATKAGNVRTRTESLLAEEGQGRIATKDVLDRLAGHQELFLRIVGTAREAVDEVDESRNGSTGAASTRSSGSAPARSGGFSRDPAAEPYARRLKELEKLIRSERIAVDSDKGLIWVDATIEGTHRMRLVVEPESDVVRLAAATATEAGIRPSDDEPPVEVATLDGRKFAARKVRLETIQIGSRVIHDVECLILPPEFGAAPPSLGGELLERFSARIDPGTGTMTLTQLQVKPILRAGEQRR